MLPISSAMSDSQYKLKSLLYKIVTLSTAKILTGWSLPKQRALYFGMSIVCEKLTRSCIGEKMSWRRSRCMSMRVLIKFGRSFHDDICVESNYFGSSHTCSFHHQSQNKDPNRRTNRNFSFYIFFT
jgi:hypothetical protein